MRAWGLGRESFAWLARSLRFYLRFCLRLRIYCHVCLCGCLLSVEAVLNCNILHKGGAKSLVDILGLLERSRHTKFYNRIA